MDLNDVFWTDNFFWGSELITDGTFFFGDTQARTKKQRNGALRPWDTGHRKSMGNPVYADVSEHQAWHYRPQAILDVAPVVRGSLYSLGPKTGIRFYTPNLLYKWMITIW